LQIRTSTGSDDPPVPKKQKTAPEEEQQKEEEGKEVEKIEVQVSTSTEPKKEGTLSYLEAVQSQSAAKRFVLVDVVLGIMGGCLPLEEMLKKDLKLR
jgi:hypothetical protein